MILYLDSSALLKRYFEEEGSREVLSLWRGARGAACSAVAYAECLSTIYRKARETRLSTRTLRSLVDSFRRDWQSLIRLNVSSDLDPLVDRLVVRHALRGFDLIHLASALVIRQRLLSDFLFTCFDERLLCAAREEGLKTFPALSA